ncbi:MAG: sodium:proton antiporter [Gemmatimonadota bacterium]|jgi:Na+/H+ antiporter NhaD/arsenite permease-like protein
MKMNIRRLRLTVVLFFLALPAPLAAQEGGQGLVSTTGPVSQGIVAVVIIALFVFLARETAHRVLIAMACASFLWAVTYLTPFKLIGFQEAGRHIDLNVLFLLAGMMTVVGVLKSTGAFEWSVGRLLVRTHGRPSVASRLVAWFTGITSAFLDNVTTVIFVTPMATGMARQIGLAPMAILLPMVVASNIGGTATLIGDPPNIMIGSGATLSFLDFMENLTAPIVVMMVVLQWYLRRYYREEFRAARESTPQLEKPAELKDPRLFRWMMVVCAAILVGFISHSLTGTPPAVPAVLGAAAALVIQDYLYIKRHKPTTEERTHGILKVLEKDIEWPTLSFFVFLFIVVGAAVETGLISSVAEGMSWSIDHVRTIFSLSDRGTLIFAALLICWVSAILSAFIDNIPYVAVSIPIIIQLIPTFHGEDTSVLWWALSLGACLGGNATVVGASANVTTVGMAEKHGVRITFAQYSRFAAPIATLTILISSAFLVSYITLGTPMVHFVFWAIAAGLVVFEWLLSRAESARFGRPGTGGAAQGA